MGDTRARVMTPKRSKRKREHVKTPHEAHSRVSLFSLQSPYSLRVLAKNPSASTSADRTVGSTFPAFTQPWPVIVGLRAFY